MDVELSLDGGGNYGIFQSGVVLNIGPKRLVVGGTGSGGRLRLNATVRKGRRKRCGVWRLVFMLHNIHYRTFSLPNRQLGTMRKVGLGQNAESKAIASIGSRNLLDP